MGLKKGVHAEAYFCASGAAAMVNFPLWKASAIGQSGYALQSGSMYGRVVEAMQPPWRGVFAVMAGMTWARAAIFYGSDRGRQMLKNAGAGHTLSVAGPPLVISTFVQVVNMPLIRASIMLQNPTAPQTSLLQMAQHITNTRGFVSLWHGLRWGRDVEEGRKARGGTNECEGGMSVREGAVGEAGGGKKRGKREDKWGNDISSALHL